MSPIRFIFIVVIGLSSITGCTVPLPGPNSPRPQGVFAKHQIWKPAAGWGIDRLELVDRTKTGKSSPPRPILRTIWRPPDPANTYPLLTIEHEELLVCLQRPEASGSFVHYDVFVYGRNRITNKIEMVTHGLVVMNGGYVPIAIVEIKVSNPELPEPRNRFWQLAIVSASPGGHEAQNARPWVLPQTSANGSDTYPLGCEIVHWHTDDEHWALPLGFGNLSDATELTYRTAEPNWPVHGSGRVLRPTPPRKN